MKNLYISQFDLSIRKNSYIQRMFDKVHSLTFDIIVSGQVVYTSFDSGDAKQFCIDNGLSTVIKS